MNSLDKLINYFEQFPGVGARQARRFAFHVLTLPPSETSELASLVSEVQTTVTECTSCRRFYARVGSEELCNICSDGARDITKLTVVERDVDIQPIERSGVYHGLYYVLGGTASLLEKKSNERLRTGGLKRIVEERIPLGLNEIVLAFSVNPDGENTGRFVETLLKDIDSIEKVSMTQLGRGLSTGSELEYADPETIKNAFRNRQ